MKPINSTFYLKEYFLVILPSTKVVSTLISQGHIAIIDSEQCKKIIPQKLCGYKNNHSRIDNVLRHRTYSIYNHN